MHQVDLIDGGAAGEFAGVAARLGHLVVLLVGDHAADRLGEGLEGGGNGIGQLRQVDHGERGGLALRAARAGGDEVVDDLTADLGRRRRGVLRELGQPFGVIPAGAGLGLLGGDEVVREIGEHQAVFERAHQTGVKADEVELHAALFERLLDPGERHRALRAVALVIAEAADRAAAVIPEDQLVAVGGEVLGAVRDKVRERVRVGHRAGARVVLEHLQVAGDDLVDLVAARADDVVVPARAAARVDDQVHLVADRGARHLQQVLGGHAAAGLEVGAAHVDHDRHDVLVPAADRREFFARAVGDGLAERRGGVLGFLPVGLLGRAEDTLQNGAAQRGIRRGGFGRGLGRDVDRGGRGLNVLDLAAASAAEQGGEGPLPAEKQDEQDHDDQKRALAAAAAPTVVVPAAFVLRKAGFGGLLRLKALAGADRPRSETRAAAIQTGAGPPDILFSALRTIVFHGAAPHFRQVLLR